MRRITAALALAAFAAGIGAPSAVAVAGVAPQRAPVAQAARCAGVWVVVDFASLGGGISTSCATSHDSGVGALRSAGFAPVVEDGFVLEIAGKPSKSDLSKAYWSYWQATKNDDGGYTDWTYSDLGAASSHPGKGDAEGWKYVSLSAGNTPPGAKPPSGETGPAATATSGAPTVPASIDPTDDRPTPDATATGDGAGSPVGAIVAGSVVVAGAAGLGGWWMMKGRKR